MSTGSASIRGAPELPILGEDRFQILERIGAGGMGTVYRAIQRSVGRPVAVKVLSGEYAGSVAGVARFVREATVVSRLVHPNIVTMIDFGRDAENNLLLVMELLEGEALRQTLRRHKRLPPWRAVQIAMQVLAALRVAHAAGVVHRDLKPENIFITRVDQNDHAKVLDFGVAKMISHDVGGHDTTAGSLVGTLKYMAPEQIAGDPPDARVDLHALGVMLYEMLSGSLPYDSKDRFMLLRSIINDPPVPLSMRVPELPQALCDVVMRSLAKYPMERYQSSEEFRAALGPFAQLGFGLPDPVVSTSGVSGVDSSAPVVGGARENATVASGRRSSPSSASIPGPTPSTFIAAPPPGPYDPSLTTGAGLSAASHRLTAEKPKRSYVGLVAVVVGVVGIASSIGILMVHKSTQQQTQTATRPTIAAAPASGGAMVTVQSSPAGAVVRDLETQEELCRATPCAVPVRTGQVRRVSVSNGAASMTVLLDPSIPMANVHLQDAPTTPVQAVQTPTVQPSATPDAGRRVRIRTRRDEGEEPGTTNIQMFGAGGR